MRRWSSWSFSILNNNDTDKLSVTVILQPNMTWSTWPSRVTSSDILTIRPRDMASVPFVGRDMYVALVECGNGGEGQQVVVAFLGTPCGVFYSGPPLVLTLSPPHPLFQAQPLYHTVSQCCLMSVSQCCLTCILEQHINMT